MPRLNALDPDQATGERAELFDAVNAKFGQVPNTFRVLGNSPAALKGFLGLAGALEEGSLTPGEREQIAIAMAEANECNYCLAAHTVMAKMAGVSEEEREAARSASSADARSAAILEFAEKVRADRGSVGDADIDALKSAGLDDAGVIEVVAEVVLNTFTNYYNKVAAPEIDFPKVPALAG